MRSTTSAKSIIMMAFFFTMPISRMMPIIAMTLSSVWTDQQRENGAHSCRRQRRENRDGMDVAFVQNSQHDVHRHQRGEDQPGLARQGCLERLCRALEARRACSPACPSRAAHSSIARTASPSATPGARLKDSVTAGNWPW